MNKKLLRIRESDEKGLSDNELQRKLDRLYGFSPEADRENKFLNDYDVEEVDLDLFSKGEGEEEEKDDENYLKVEVIK